MAGLVLASVMKQEEKDLQTLGLQSCLQSDKKRGDYQGPSSTDI